MNGGTNLLRLVESALAQSCVPLEIVVVDGGSTDGSVEALGRLTSEPNRLRILQEGSIGPLMRGPANARNLGAINSKGTYLFFFDSDFELTDPNIVHETCEALDEHPWVGVHVVPRIDTWLEYHASIDDYRKDLRRNVHAYCEFTREVFERLMFDPSLGLGEDGDLRKRAKQNFNLEPTYINAPCERHFVHTFRQWERQALWHGRTHVRFVSKWREWGLQVLAFRAGAFVSLLFSLIFAAISPLFCLAFVGVFLARILGAYIYSATHRRHRLFYLFLRESYWGGAFLLGFISGLMRGLLTSRIKR